MISIGIDIGGTTIKGALFKENIIIKKASLPTCGKVGREAILNSLYGVLDELFLEEVEFIGISSAGDINFETGECVYATDNLTGWTGLNIKETIERKYHVPCKVDNDAICALIAEADALEEKKNVVMITLGTGLGVAVIQDGKIFRGDNFDRGKLAHISLPGKLDTCFCGNKGCAELYLSATALLEQGQRVDTNLKSCFDLFEKYRHNNQASKEIINDFMNYLNNYLCIINEKFSPNMIILGGGVSLSKDIIMSLLLDKNKNVCFAKYGELAGIYGAKMLYKFKEN